MIKTKKRAIICFYKGDINDDIRILEDLDSKGFEVHLFDNVDEENLNFDILLCIIKDLYGIKSSEYDIYISSNIKEFIMLEYILYNNLISGALYINNNPKHIKLDKLYEKIINEEMRKGTNKSNFYVLKNEENIFNEYYIFGGDFQYSKDNYKSPNKLYTYMRRNYVFFINNKSNNNVEIIDLDNSGKVEEYIYCLNLGYVDEYLKLIEKYSNFIEDFTQSYKMIYMQLNEFKTKILNLPYFEKNMVQFKLDNNLYNKIYNDKYKIFLSSVLFTLFNERVYLEFLLKLLIESTEINEYNRFFAYCQCERHSFVSKDISSENIDMMLEQLYEKIFDEFSVLGKRCVRVPKKQLNDSMVFVVTSQFININHAPTKIALDVCYNFIKNLNKKVVLINTKEVGTLKGMLPMMNIMIPNVLEQYNNINEIKYKGIRIPLYQPEVLMPDESEILNILDMLQKYKPSLIINIGNTLVGDLCTNLIPTVTLPLAIDGYSKSTFYLVNDKNAYEKYIKKHCRNKESIIISRVQFELKSQERTFTKEELEIPRNKFIVAVIGNRLNEEIDENFLEVLEKSCRFNNAYVLFIDKFNFNKHNVVKYKNLINNYKNMGYQQDLLAVLENVDIYVNPNRSGGGTSAIYAMYLGKPVVSLNCGDVAGNVGKEFCISNYGEMLNEINKYYNDSEYYNKQSRIARQRALNLTDMSSYVKDIYSKVIKSKLF